MVLIDRLCSPTAERLQRLEADQLPDSYLFKDTLVSLTLTSLEDVQGLLQSPQPSASLRSILTALTIFLTMADGLISAAASPWKAYLVNQGNTFSTKYT